MDDGTDVAPAMTQVSADWERLRPFYRRATIMALAEIGSDGQYYNVNTTIVFGTDRTRQRSYQCVSESSRGHGHSGRFWANIAVVENFVADEYLIQAQNGRAIFPKSITEIVYDLDARYDGFIPRGDFPDEAYDKVPGNAPAWRRRFVPRLRSVNGVPLSEARLADVVAELPRFSRIDYEALNLEHALDRVGALDVLYPTQVKAEFHADPDGVRYRVDDPLGWIAKLGETKLSVEFYQLGLIVGARAFAPQSTGMLAMVPPQGVRYWLTAGGVVLDGSGGTFLRVIHVKFGVMLPDISVTIAGSTASIPVSPRISSRVSSGEVAPLPDVFEPKHLAVLWREQVTRRSLFVERVFDGRNAQTSRTDGLRLLSEIVRAEIAQRADPVIVRVVDPFGIGIETIRAIIPVAAGVPHGEIWLLSKNETPPANSMRDRLARWLHKFIAWGRGIDPQDILDAKFALSAAALARNLSVKIRWYKPSISIHDRFLEIGARIWHVGHSFNRFGCDLSAIVELRDLVERARLRAILDEQFVDANLRRSFP